MRITRSAVNPSSYKIDGHPYWYQRNSGNCNRLLDTILDNASLACGGYIEPGETVTFSFVLYTKQRSVEEIECTTP